MADPTESVHPWAEMDKAVRCLALEVPASVHDDVVARWESVKATRPRPNGPVATLARTLFVMGWGSRDEAAERAAVVAALLETEGVALVDLDADEEFGSADVFLDMEPSGPLRTPQEATDGC